MEKLTRNRIIVTTVILIICSVAVTTIVPTSTYRKSEQWFFDNLTPEQRLHIRKAIDYAIPRDQIIEEIRHGLGKRIASPIRVNDIAYDPAIATREYNLTKALDHMEEVFGYRYNKSQNKTDTSGWYFSMVILCPTTRYDRMEWAAVTTESLQKIGIAVTLKYANWNIINSRIFKDEEDQGYDYEHGGFDGLFYGWEGATESDVRQWFGEENWPPYGNNFGYINNPEVDEILGRAYESPSRDDRLFAFKEFQVWFKENLPYYIVLQPMDLWVRDPDLKGVSFSFDYPNYGNWTHSTDDIITIQTPGTIENLNPFMANSYYDNIAIKENFDTLLVRYPEDPSIYHGNLAERWTTSNDNLVWTFKIREGIKFSNNTDLTADDVVFSYKKFIEPTVNAVGGKNIAAYINNSNIVKINESSVQITLNSFNAYTEELIGALPILSMAQMDEVPNTQWATDTETNKENAPIGSGPFKINVNHTNVSKGYVSLELNPYYNGSVRNPEGQFVNIDRLPKINIKRITDIETAIEELENGTIHIIDSKMDLQPYVDEINNSTWGTLEEILGWGHEAFYINQIDPIWGMTPGDPREMYPVGIHPIHDPTAEILVLFLGSISIVTIIGVVIGKLWKTEHNKNHILRRTRKIRK